MFKAVIHKLIRAQLLILLSIIICFGENTNNKQHHNPNRPLIIVSGVDGRLAALDGISGDLRWTLDLGSGPLISSSISKLIYKEDGKSIRLIPSLSGELYRFDGEAVEAVPFDIDQLLSSSFRLAEDTVLVGGRETSTSGIDSYNGRVLYTCNASGCDKNTEVKESEGVVIIKRRQQTIRSIENRNGNENWNFSVGEINLDFAKGRSVNLIESSGETEDVSDKEPSNSGDKCFTEDSEMFGIHQIDLIKVIVPDGTVCMVGPKNKHKILWKYQFKTPISAAWLLYNAQVYKLNLFDPARVPALEKDSPGKELATKDTIYMGTFKSDVYIQAAPSVQKAIAIAAHYNTQGTNSKNKSPRFSYQPYLANTDRLTQATVGQSDKSDDGASNELVVKGKPPIHGSCRNRLTIDDELESGGGYYLQGDVSYLSRARLQGSKKQGRATIDSFENESYNQYDIEVVYSSVMHYWKELLILTVSVSIFVQCLIAKIIQVKGRLTGRDRMQEAVALPETDLPPNYSINDVPGSVFESRFTQDFEPLECLGKGGFGVVFKARNKMDDCQYAVKRILLPNNVNAREKVLREVRALAKLEHPSIVRYFNAWSEHPPQGWQRQRDETLLKDLSAWSHSHTTHHQHQANGSEFRAAIYTETRASDASDAHHNDVTHPKDTSSERASCSSGDSHVTFDRCLGAAIDETAAFAFSPKLDAGDTLGSWKEDSTEGFGGLQTTSRGRFFQGGKFFQSASLSSNWNNSSTAAKEPTGALPFGRYGGKQDSVSVVFGDDGYSSRQQLDNSAQSEQTQSTDGKAESDPAPDTEIKLRKRSFSGNRYSRNTSLREVVCGGQPVEGEKANPSERDRPERTMYLYIQMQLCHKDSLREWLVANSNGRDRVVCIDIFQQVVSAVTYVHDQSLIHRDLKPSNVFFSLDGTVKVGDFGLVTQVGDGAVEETELPEVFAEEHRHTQQVGTRMYMAPEQMTSRSYCSKVDVYALGLILFELVNPFGTQMERIRHLTDARKLKFADSFVHDFPQEACLAQSMLSRDPCNRPSSHEVARDQLFADLGENSTTSRRTRTSSSRSSDSLTLS